MTRRRKHPGRATRCKDCDAPIVFRGSPFTSRSRPFDLAVLDSRALTAGPRAYPVMGGRAYQREELVDLVQQLRECTRGEADDEVNDMPWMRPHECPTRLGLAPPEPAPVEGVQWADGATTGGERR